MTHDPPLAALQAIRDFELEMARHLEAAELAADESVRRARAEQHEALAAAEGRGRAEADRRFAEAIARAQADAEEIRAQGATQVNQLGHRVRASVGGLVDELVELVLAEPLEEGS